MTDLAPSALREDGDDRILPFQIEELDVRGRIVRLGPSIDAVLERHAYPPAVSKLVGEAAALTALLGSALKIEGRFQLQTRSDGPVGMLVVDFEAPDRLRACARFDADRLDGAAGAGALLGRGHMALTVDQGPDLSRYQGVVALDGGSLEDAAHTYFQQSEQIPTKIRLAVAESFGAGARHSWRAGGILAQFLPEAPERMRVTDLPPGDAPEGVEAYETEEDDAWVEAQTLVATVEDHELIDPTLAPERLLIRLFNEREIRVFDSLAVREACRCSRERVRGMLKSFSGEERRDMRMEDGGVTVTCDFCSTAYPFAAPEVDAIDAEAEADAGTATPA
ncbi:33 kDa chaperonin [Methylopila jiangsuensis]|uniref:33 kDa chaperonin n=1 Tax=Methylopila jiangsuensis TaxID=586230 RepID=A0A9W6JJD1_9HYPH|nr:Hsp33 family molecular chaperone [Methylopila jiangsuensis]MDR6284515.1 molecular chaperone Hsp33 [Methylopila jiangsuensis]GLK78097.1 33 kDa chaperonin [Methylopila jiangsuensis]